ncbi:Alpha/Beta hydrolase protein [Flammula alnicola]|nr:Alpha/Beta hydrolase protein [Flammula alnicola]
MTQMEKIKVTDSIEFAYHDSGAPPTKEDYFTIVLIHGHTYHSGTFAPMLAAANSFGYRIILPNRRLYPGSTPYTKEETEAFEATNSTEDITKIFLKQGEYLLLFVNNVIKKLDLKKVILVGWSLGTAFLNVTVAAITTVDEEVKARLRQTVKTIVWWDPPATAHGIPDPPSGGWIPLYDEDLTPEERGQAFGQWLAQYYPHPNLDKKDCFTLIYKITTPVTTPTFTGISFEEFLTKVDLTAGVNGDNHIPDKHFQPVAKIARELAFFNAKVREAWGNIPFNVIYGEESPYNVLWSVWQLEAESEKTGLPLNFKAMPHANHFAMNDHTKLVFDTLHTCL